MLLAGYKLVSLLSFRGRKGDAAARTLVSASIWRDSAEGKSGTYGVSAQTVRNYVEDQGLSVIGKVLDEVRGISARMLGGQEDRSIARLDRDKVPRQIRGGPGIRR